MKVDQNVEWKRSWRASQPRRGCIVQPRVSAAPPWVGSPPKGRTLKGFYNYRSNLDKVRSIEPLQGSDCCASGPRVARRSAPAYPGLYDKTPSGFARSANAFFRAGEIEAWGRGIRLILEACRAAKTPEPEICCQASDMFVGFRCAETTVSAAEVVTTPKTTPKTVPTTPQTTRETVPTTPETTQEAQGEGAWLDEKLDGRLDEKLDEKLGERRAAIVRLMAKNARVTVSEIARALQISRTAADKNIQILKTKGYIRRIGPTKGGHWEVLK